LEALATKQ